MPNSYNPDYNFWSGWAISADNDVSTPGFMNDLSAITGAGYDGSTTYAVSFAGSGSQMKLTGPAQGGQVSGMYVTNGTYAYLSMLEGDGFAKKFGGETGDDPDFFLLTIKGYANGQLGNDSVDFYLADYRFSDNAQDYIVDEWTWVDLSSLGNVDSLQFSMNSTDVGQFGMNTPAYFCVDNVVTTDMPSPAFDIIPDDVFSIYPNPVADQLYVLWEQAEEAELLIRNLAGQLIHQTPLQIGVNAIPIQRLPAGQYVAEIRTGHQIAAELLLKK